jgi:hypothetical protein
LSAGEYIQDVDLVIREELAKNTPPNSPGRFAAERLGALPPALDLGQPAKPVKGSSTLRGKSPVGAGAAHVRWAPGTPSPPMSRERMHKKARAKSVEETGA